MWEFLDRVKVKQFPPTLFAYKLIDIDWFIYFLMKSYSSFRTSNIGIIRPRC